MLMFSIIVLLIVAEIMKSFTCCLPMFEHSSNAANSSTTNYKRIINLSDLYKV